MTDRPINPHLRVRTDGQPTQFKKMTDKLCPVCNPASNGAKMGIVSDTSGTRELECEHCGYTEFSQVVQ